MNINLIKNEDDYNTAINRIDMIINAKADTDEIKELELLSILIEDYESKHYTIDAPDPISALLFRMEQLSLTRKDLEKYIGPRSRVSDILNHKRKLSISMIRKLNKYLHIPAEILIQDYK
jgi:HTH-type transcriptional regulator/antitoxin HigA